MDAKMTSQEIKEAFLKHSDMVYRLAFARTKSSYDADDILQEVFLRLLKSKTVPVNEEHLKATIIRITINCSKSLLTSAPFKRNVELREDIPASDTDFETLDAALRLPKKYRTVVHLHYYCGYKTDEIASLLYIKPSTVKSQLFRARQMLEKSLKGANFDV